MSKFVFKPLEITDLSSMYQWFNHEPEINKWYGYGRYWSWQDIEKRYLPRLQPVPQENIPSFKVYYNNTVIGFIQYYSLADFLPDGMTNRNHPLFEKFPPAKIGGVDMFNLGAASEIYGKGAGAAILNEFVDLYVKPLFKMIVLDPAQDNIRAIKCYEKCGFKHFCTVKNEDNTEIAIMYLEV